MRSFSPQELKYRYERLRDGLQIESDEIMNMLIETRREDDKGIEAIIRGEGEKNIINNFMIDIEDSFLGSQDIDTIYKYLDRSPEEWDFITEEQKAILRNTENFYKRIKRNYMLYRAYLMILRKEVINFVEVTIKKLNNKDEIQQSELFKEMTRYIISNYTYKDTMKELGFEVQRYEELKEDKLYRYKLDEKKLIYK